MFSDNNQSRGFESRKAQDLSQALNQLLVILQCWNRFPYEVIPKQSLSRENQPWGVWDAQVCSWVNRICELRTNSGTFSSFPCRRPPLAMCHLIAFTCSEYRPCVGMTCAVTSVRRCSFKVSLVIVFVPTTVPNAASFLRNLVHRGCKPYSGSSGRLGLSLGLEVSEADRRRGKTGLSLHCFIWCLPAMPLVSSYVRWCGLPIPAIASYLDI